MAGRDVEKAELVGARRIIGDRRLDRIAGIAQIDEIDALDDAAVLDVEAGNDANFEHQDLCWRAARMSRKRFTRLEPTIVERASRNRAGELSCARGWSSALMSSIEANPPDAITGV